MKRTFLRILPLAVAVLLATSCSKDENNDNVVVDQQEQVVNQEKTVSINGSVNVKSGISKLSTSDGIHIQFDGTETINFSGDEGKIHGSTTVNSDGSFTVDLSYPASEQLSYLNGKSLIATIGTEPTELKAYDNFAAALADAYEVSSPVALSVNGDNVTFSGNVEMNINVAFVKNETVWTYTVQVGTNYNNLCHLDEGQICIVPVGVRVYAQEKRISSPVAGGIYTIEPVYVDLGVVLDDGTKVDFSNGQGVNFEWDSRTEEGRKNWPTVNEIENLISDCYWQWDDTEHHEGYYVFKVHDPNDAGKGTYNNHTPSRAYNTDDDNYIFLYATCADPTTVWGEYMTKESNDGWPLGLYFKSSEVNPKSYFYGGGLFMVRRSN